MEKVTEEFVIAIYDHLEGVHELIIRDTGGLEEVRDKGGLYHSSWKIAEKINNNTGALKVASFIFYELAKKHHFNDENSRTLKEIEFWIGNNIEAIQKTKDINSFLDILYKDLEGMKR